MKNKIIMSLLFGCPIYHYLLPIIRNTKMMYKLENKYTK
jgi:hypothetical protein